MTIRTVTLIFFLASLSGAGFAASDDKMVFLNKYDLDGDWNLFSAEFDHARLRGFERIDTNNDKVISEQEYVFNYQDQLNLQLSKDRKGHVKQTGVRFNALDKNNNAQMEWEEYKASGLRSFARYDTNKDGQIDNQDEAPTYSWHKQSTSNLTREEKAKRRDRMLAYAKRALRMPTTHNKQGMLVKYDADNDGVVTKAEHTQARKATFTLTDEDGNGWVSDEEYLNEFLNRVDTQIANTRIQQKQQSYTRFKALDSNNNGTMSFVEYQHTGRKMFALWDTDGNQIITMEENMPSNDEQQSSLLANNE